MQVDREKFFNCFLFHAKIRLALLALANRLLSISWAVFYTSWTNFWPRHGKERDIYLIRAHLLPSKWSPVRFPICEYADSIDEHSIFLCGAGDSWKLSTHFAAVVHLHIVRLPFGGGYGPHPKNARGIADISHGVHCGRKLNFYLSNTICVIGCDISHIRDDLSIVAGASFYPPFRHFRWSMPPPCNVCDHSDHFDCQHSISQVWCKKVWKSVWNMSSIRIDW